MPSYEMALTITVNAECYDDAEALTEGLAKDLDLEDPELGFSAACYNLDTRGRRVVLLPPVETGLSPVIYRACDHSGVWRPARR